jgi:hypothetical protein
MAAHSGLPSQNAVKRRQDGTEWVGALGLRPRREGVSPHEHSAAAAVRQKAFDISSVVIEMQTTSAWYECAY